MKRIDLTGKRYGKLLVLGIDPEHSHHGDCLLWKCQCDCGNICYKTKDSLDRGIKTNPNTLGCDIRCTKSIPIGTKIGRLTIQKLIREEGQETKYECLCDCGNIITVMGTNLKNGNTKSCGCWHKEHMSMIGNQYNNITDLTGKIFGELTVLEPAEERKSYTRSMMWKCKCSCGNFYNVTSNHLQTGNVTRCDKCQIVSKGEEKITKILLENNISFIKQKTFESCRFEDTHALAKFDFYIDNKYLIEFDGKQHFNFSISGWNTKEKLEKNQKRDNFKNNWCKENNIPLLRIPYWDLDKITINDLLVTPDNKYLI